MKRIALIAALVFGLGIALGSGDPENFGGDGQAFTSDDDGQHYVHTQGVEGDLRFHWDYQHIVVPSDEAAEHAADKNVVVEEHEHHGHEGETHTLIDPQDTHSD